MAALPGSLAKLGEGGVDILVGYLSLGLNDRAIARKIQEDDGLLTDVKLDTLARNVRRWRESTGQNAVTLGISARLIDSRGRLRPHIDTLDEMSVLIEKQKARVKKALDQEEGMGNLLLEMTSNEMIRLYAMLEKLSKLQIETGILRKVRPGTVRSDYEDPEEEEELQTGPWTPQLEQRFRMIEEELMKGDVIEGDYTEVDE